LLADLLLRAVKRRAVADDDDVRAGRRRRADGLGQPGVLANDEAEPVVAEIDDRGAPAPGVK
jgi:hypothetical protein